MLTVHRTGLYPKYSKYLRVKGVLSTLLDQGFKGSNMPSEENLGILQLKHRESFFFQKISRKKKEKISGFHSIPYCKLRPELGTTWNTYINIHPLPFHDNIFNKQTMGKAAIREDTLGFPNVWSLLASSCASCQRDSAGNAEIVLGKNTNMFPPMVIYHGKK